MSAPLHYEITASDRQGHYFTVTLNIASPDPDGQRIRLAAWLPGSYMIRDFAKNVVELHAFDEQGPVEVTRIDKQQWQLPPSRSSMVVRYTVYAWDLSVRTAYLDDQFGFYNHSALCLEVCGQADQPCDVTINGATDQPDWKVVTGMPRVSGSPQQAGCFRASNYQELVDYPVLMGDLDTVEFIAHGTRHRIAIAGRHFADMERISADLARVCECQLELFGGDAPFENYTFLVMVVGNGFGGLEHRNSTALLCSRKDLISTQQTGSTESYRTFLSLCSHEYFHSWNIKRLRPREFIPYRLDKEQYTSQLWFYEGVTSYYDDYLVYRAGLSSTAQYLQSLGAIVSRGLSGKGVTRQSLVESSQLAWTTFYQQNENAANAISSYYSKGAVVALCVDLIIRQHSNGLHSLDDVMRHLWSRFGIEECGTRPDDLIDAMVRFGGNDVAELIDRALYTTAELPLQKILQRSGISLTRCSTETEGGTPGKAPRIELPVALGARFNATEHGLTLQQVHEGGAAYTAGLSAGDRIIALDNLQIGQANQLEFWSRYKPGDRVVVHAFRRDELQQRTLEFQAPAANNYVLSIADRNKTGSWLVPGR